jgi:hypothetical protein
MAMVIFVATLATQAMACETTRTRQEAAYQARADNSAAADNFQARISGDAAVQKVVVQP